MGDTIIITDDDKPTPAPKIVVVQPEAKPKVEKVIIEKTTVIHTKDE